VGSSPTHPTTLLSSSSAIEQGFYKAEVVGLNPTWTTTFMIFKKLKIRLTKDVVCLHKTFDKGEVLEVTHEGELPTPSNVGVYFFIHGYNNHNCQTCLWWDEFELLPPAN
jgi:hypothetical protein